MEQSRVVEALAGMHNFQRLDRESLARVAALAKPLHLTRGQQIFSAGESAVAFYLVCQGGVRLYRLAPDGREQLVLRVGPGDSFGEAAALNLGRYPVSAEATAKSELLAIEAAAFIGLLEEYPKLAAALVGNLCQRHFALVRRVEELSAASAGARLARLLVSLPAQVAEEGMTIELPEAKKDLAARLAIAPETLSRLLRRWREQGVIQVQGRRLVLRRTEVLEALAAEA